MSDAEFGEACRRVLGAEKQFAGIGTMGEKTLHAILKLYFEPNRDCHEVAIGGFVADVANEGGITEIQTRGFNKLRKKLAVFLEDGPVTVVYPMPRQRWITWIDKSTGELSKRTKGRKTGSIFDCFYELYKIKPQLAHPNLRLCLMLLDMDEYRWLDGWDKSKKRGSTRCERIPLLLADELYFECPEDYIRLVPDGLGDEFTAKDYAAAASLRLCDAQTGLNILTSLNAVERIGKNGNAYIYRRSFEPVD